MLGKWILHLERGQGHEGEGVELNSYSPPDDFEIQPENGPKKRSAKKEKKGTLEGCAMQTGQLKATARGNCERRLEDEIAKSKTNAERDKHTPKEDT